MPPAGGRNATEPATREGAAGHTPREEEEVMHAAIARAKSPGRERPGRVYRGRRTPRPASPSEPATWRVGGCATGRGANRHAAPDPTDGKSRAPGAACAMHMLKAPALPRDGRSGEQQPPVGRA